MSGAHDPTLQAFARLLRIVDTLRAPDGCPWDRRQTAGSMKPYVIEEAYEVVEAIDEGDPRRLREELGDLLLQVVFQAQLGDEVDAFSMEEVCAGIADKMERRHPHVFGDARADDEAAVDRGWERIKVAERAERGEPSSVLAGVPRGLPALLTAARLSDKAAAVGFDWPDVRGVLDKIREEIDELDAAIHDGDGSVQHELGDLLFAMANLGRTLERNPEDALRDANRRFVRRFGHIERTLAERGVPWEHASLDEMEALWQQAKRREDG